jgi:hypothetical protein
MLTADLLIRRGDTYYSPQWAVVFDGGPLTLTAGWTIRAQVRPTVDSATVLYEFPAEQTVITTVDVLVGDQTVETSAVRLYAPPEDTATFALWLAWWDLEISNPEAGPNLTLYRKTIVGGRVLVAADVTRPAA